jgi:tetratricopeptide (TPR) repeat protein
VRISGDFVSRYFQTSEDSASTKRYRDDAVGAISRIFDDSTYTPSSLAEWARNIDLEPLLQKRKEIHRQKREGRLSPTQPKVSTNIKTPEKSSTHHHHHEDNFSTAEYLKSLARALRAPSSPFASNIQVKELYSAAKQADQLGERKVAMDLLQTLLMVTPNDARVYRRLARMHAESDDVQQARETLQAGLEHQSENSWLWHGLGQLELTHGSIELAKEYFQKAIGFDAAFAQSYHALGTLEHGQGNVANAMRILKKGLEFCPTNHRLWHACGDVYREAQMLEDAERSYKRALELGPPTSHGFAQSSLAAVAYEQGNLDKARRWLFKAIEGNNGRHSQGWVALAQLEESVGNIREARLLCTSAIAQYERGLVESRQRYLKQSGQRQVSPRPAISENGPISRELTTQLLKQVPAYRSGDKFVHVYRNWARLEEEHGDAAAVDRVYQRAKVAFPQDSRLLVSWAQYHDRNLNVEQAREIYQEACAKAGQRYVQRVGILGIFLFFQLSVAHNKLCISACLDTLRRIGCLGILKCLNPTFMKHAEFCFLEREPSAKPIS